MQVAPSDLYDAVAYGSRNAWWMVESACEKAGIQTRRKRWVNPVMGLIECLNISYGSYEYTITKLAE